MAWEEGKSGNPKGKEAGTLAKHTKAAKFFFSTFTYENAAKMQDAFDDLLAGSNDDKKEALKIYLSYSERIVPKMTQSTVDVTSGGQIIAQPAIYVNGDPPTSQD